MISNSVFLVEKACWVVNQETLIVLWGRTNEICPRLAPIHSESAPPRRQVGDRVWEGFGGLVLYVRYMWVFLYYLNYMLNLQYVCRVMCGWVKQVN